MAATPPGAGALGTGGVDGGGSPRVVVGYQLIGFGCFVAVVDSHPGLQGQGGPVVVDRLAAIQAIQAALGWRGLRRRAVYAADLEMGRPLPACSGWFSRLCSRADVGAVYPGKARGEAVG